MPKLKLSKFSIRELKDISDDSWVGARPKPEISENSDKIVATLDGSAATVHKYKKDGEVKTYIATYNPNPST
ncbi:MAG: hypothetical protein F6K50_06325 [Moorea sp. SIO3I7]|nr:hypothetical protein [Moorena sp. SIO3I7]